MMTDTAAFRKKFIVESATRLPSKPSTIGGSYTEKDSLFYSRGSFIFAPLILRCSGIHKMEGINVGNVDLLYSFIDFI